MATLEIILSLFTQLSFLVTCTLLFGVLKPFLKPLNKRSRDLVQGGLFGLFAIVVMLNPIQVVNGVLFDLRGVIIVVAGALYGVIPALVVGLFVILYRLLLGGVGAPVAIGSAVTGVVLGISLYRYKEQHVLPLRRTLVSLGFAAALETLFWLSLLPVEKAGQVIAMIALPIFLVYPVSSWIFGSLLLYQERHLELEESLSAERTMLRTLIDHIPDYIFVKDKAKRFTLSNLAQAHAAAVADPAELLGFSSDHFFPAEVVTQPNVDDETVLLGASILAQERQTLHKDGTFLWLSTTKVPLRDAQGEVIGIVGISRDITAYKRAEDALQRERNLLRTLIDAVPANVYIKDVQSRFVDANAETIHKLGVATRSDLVGKTDFDFFAPELAAQYLADEQTLLQSGQPLLNREEPSVDQHSGQPLWLLTTKAPIQNEQGEVTGLVGIGLDVTGRKQVEQALRENEAKLKTFFEVLPVGVSILDDAGQIVEMNPTLERILDISVEGLLSGVYRSRKYLASDGRPMECSAFPSARVRVEQQVIHDVEVGVVKEDQTTIWTSVSAAPLPGTKSGVIMVTADITERKRFEQQALELSNERQRTQVLHQFIGDATHDLMTPIAGINLSVDLARRASTPDRLIAHLDKIEILSEKLQERLQDMLMMSQLDMMTAENLELQTVDLGLLLQHLVETFRPQAEAKEQQLSVEIDSQRSTLQADDLYLNMALAKVVENAIHYTEKGGTVQISITRHDSLVAIAIRDTGIGITEADLAHIFERFYRAKSHRPLDSGAGLGLSIAQRILDLHRGRIEVSSAVGSGSTFTFFLPVN